MGEIYDRIKQLSKKKKISITNLEKELGWSRGSMCKIDNHVPSGERLMKLASTLETTPEYILKGQLPLFSNLEKMRKNIDTYAGQSDSFSITKAIIEAQTEFIAPDERDIAKDLENIRRKLQNGEEGVASFEGVDIPPEDQELFLGQVELMLRRLKAINKVKYNPHKNGN